MKTKFLNYGEIIILDIEYHLKGKKLLIEKLKRYDMYGNIKILAYKRLSNSTLFLWEQEDGDVSNEFLMEKINTGWVLVDN